MSFHSQQESFLPYSNQKRKYINKSYKRKKHDSDTKLIRSKSSHKIIIKQIRAEVKKEFEQKYAQKDKIKAEICKNNAEIKNNYKKCNTN